MTSNSKKTAQTAQLPRVAFENKTYPYKFKASVALMGLLFFGFCAFVFSYLALHNDRGLVINRIIQLETGGATIVYWLLFVLAMPFILLSFLILWKGLSNKREILLNDHGITAPKKGLSQKNLTIPYQEISELIIEECQAQYCLKIISNTQKLSIPAIMLPSKVEFEDLVAELNRRIK